MRNILLDIVQDGEPMQMAQDSNYNTVDRFCNRGYRFVYLSTVKQNRIPEYNNYYLAIITNIIQRLQSIMEEKAKSLSYILRLLADKLDANECNSYDIENLEEMVCDMANPLVSKQFGMRITGKNENSFKMFCSRWFIKPYRTLLYRYKDLKK